MGIHRLHHVQITVPKGSEEEARRFYSGTLGLKEIPKPPSLSGRGGFWLQLGEMEIHIGTENDVDRNRTKAHIAFQVDKLDIWRHRLTDAGAPILDSIPIPGWERFELRDPFGNRLEMIQRI